MTCIGRGDANGDHCCYVRGKVCDYLIENHEGRRFACGLMAELGDWEKVHSDSRYEPMAIAFANIGLCGEWQPNSTQCCNQVR